MDADRHHDREATAGPGRRDPVTEPVSSSRARPATDAEPIGVVIATRNRAAQLATTLRQLRQLPERPVVVVADNASTDHTRAMVNEDFPDVRLLTLPTNRGPLARTDGVRALTDVPYIAFSDDDSWWEPGALATAARLLSEHPRLGLLASSILVGPDGDPDPLHQVLLASPLGTAADLPGQQVLGFLGCAAVVRRDAYLDSGGYHPLLFIGGEETCLAYDLVARGWGVTYCPEVVARHYPARDPRPGRDATMLRNALLTAWLRRPAPVAWNRTAELGRRARRDPVARRALRDALTLLPASLRARRRLPPHVERAVRAIEGEAAADA